MNIKRIFVLVLFFVTSVSFAACGVSPVSPVDYAVLQAQTEAAWALQPNDMERYEALKTHLDNVLKYGKDQTGTPTPLFYSGINIDTKEPVQWLNYISGEEPYIISNFATQQNLMRALDAMTALSNNPKYRNAAAEATQYMFKNCTSDMGLLWWGGHIMVNAANEKLVTAEDFHHELKFALPNYAFLAEVDKNATAKHLEAMWRGHTILSNNVFELNRHAYLTEAKNKLHPPKPFERDYSLDYPVLFASKNNSFVNIACDMVYAAGHYYSITGDMRALEWAKTLANLYVKAAHPKTGILPYQYSYSGPHNYGPDAYKSDKCYPQLGEDFGLAGTSVYHLYGRSSAYLPMTVFAVYDLVGEPFADIKDIMVDKLKNYLIYAANEDGTFKTILADGSDLSNYVLKTDGYLGKAGKLIGSYTDDVPVYATASLRAYKLSNDPFFWNIIRAVCKQQGLGDIGSEPCKDVQMNTQTESTNGYFLMLLTEMFELTKEEAYRDTARKIGDNIVSNNIQDGFITRGQDYQYLRFEDIDACALAALHASLIGQYDAAPQYIGQSPFIEGILEVNGIKYENNGNDNSSIFSIKR